MTEHTPISNEVYKEILNTMPICTVDVMFFNSDMTRVLLFRRTNEPLKGVYYSIGGRLLKNEALEDCALRQSIREADLHIEKNRLKLGGVQNEIFSISVFEGVSYHAMGLFYIYTLSEKEISELPISLDDQHDNYQWFPINDDAIHLFLKKRMDLIHKKS